MLNIQVTALLCGGHGDASPRFPMSLSSHPGFSGFVHVSVAELKTSIKVPSSPFLQ